MKLRIQVQTANFDVAAEQALLVAQNNEIGATASFVGWVREDQGGDSGGVSGSPVVAMTLEHYPGMTEKALQRIAVEATRRWRLQGVTVIHRVGSLQPGDPIVLVMTASSHRKAAFEACNFIMDILKTEAPFWKKESLSDGSTRWVEARHSDATAANRWLKD